jgi:hypothetical protein
MSLPITNNFTTTNRYNDNISAKKKLAEFLSHKVYLTNPTSSTQEQSRSYDTSNKISDRSSTLANSLNTITIRPVNEFNNENEMLDYFNEIMAFIYESHNVELNSKFKIYISKRKARINHYTTMSDRDLYKGLSNLCKFIVEYLTNNNNDILDIMDALFYPSMNQLAIPRKSMDYFITATDKQLKELAVNKNLYRTLLVSKQLSCIDLNNIKPITNSKKEHDTKREIMLRQIDESTAVESKKSLTKGYIKDLFDICLKKDINIDSYLIIIIRHLLETKQITDDDIKQILEKINLFFNGFDDNNTVIDTSILTKICISNYNVLNRHLLSILNMTGKQIQFITSCKNRCKIMQPWIFKGFPETKEIDKIINNHKKKNTADNSIKCVITDSASYSKPQSDSINLTKTKDSHHTDIVLASKQIANDEPKKIDRRVNAYLTGNNKKVNDKSVTLLPYTTDRIKILDNFKDKITSIYTQNNVTPKADIIKYINQTKKDKTNYIPDIYLSRFLEGISNIISISLEKGYNAIFDITDAIIYRKCNRLHINQKLITNFIGLTDEQVKEIAENINFYKALLVNKNRIDIDFKNIESFILLITENNSKKEKIIYTIIDRSMNSSLIKCLIKKHTTNIVKICNIKNITIDDTLVLFIKNLSQTKHFAHTKIKKFFEKIELFFNCVDDYNTIINTSILTKIYCCDSGTTSEKLVEGICDITNEEIQGIASCESRKTTGQPSVSKEFPAAENIQQNINYLQKNNTDDNSTDVSAGYSNPQPDIIDLTNTENSSPTAINFQDTDKALNPEQAAKFDDSIEQLDYKNNEMKQNEQEEDDELFAWLDANPNFLAGPNGAINSNPELILPTKRPISPSLYSEEYNQNKIPKLDFSFLD